MTIDHTPFDRCPRCSWALASTKSPSLNSPAGPSIDPQSRRNALALIAALRSGELDEVQQLLAMPYEVNATDERGATPLMIAAYRGFAEVCRTLLLHGADARYYVTNVYPGDDADGLAHDEDDRASSRAIMSGNSSTINLIRRAELRALWSDALAVRESDPSWFAYVGPKFLVDAAELGMVSLCAEMLESGVPAEPADKCGSDALRTAAANFDERISLLLVAMGASIDAVGSEGLFSEKFSDALSRERLRIANLRRRKPTP